MPHTKNCLEIRLTESVVFLRGGDGTGRHRTGTQPTAPPAMIRGLLTLNVAKPTKISSIEVELSFGRHAQRVVDKVETTASSLTILDLWKEMHARIVFVVQLGDISARSGGKSKLE
ncbi:hypothetical protein PHLCEN_2v11416 [Hermanssonia centrifuga]|uniref:Uncharacterized protein n=1 Tax=Hermanssonia centrifuga TaxID=98765 RepID=A0A2R6NK91_9APHY|nr:hypothetical protein PHLCEN_2v11416 [Hermanssonia centrifuga]